MERKFTTPVSMACSKGNYILFLKEYIENLGYTESYMATDIGIIVNNLQDQLGVCGLIDISMKSDYDRYFIDQWNPELFLALAAMSLGDEFWLGEWVVYNQRMPYGINEYRLLRCESCTDTLIHVWDSEIENITNGHVNNFRKATKEEIIAHFTNEYQDQAELKVEYKEFLTVSDIKWIFELKGRVEQAIETHGGDARVAKQFGVLDQELSNILLPLLRNKDVREFTVKEDKFHSAT